ncbi:MAG: hypothetical protein AB1762_00675 [Gemmatimonadota bacterium]
MRRGVKWSFLAAPVLILALGACEADGGIAGPLRGDPPVFGGRGAVVDTIVVGSWSRTVSSIDNTGFPRSVETIWTFNTDGSATRSNVTRNEVVGIVDRQEAFARWTIQADQIVIDFTAPFSQRVQLPFQRNGDNLTLGGLTFLRLL